MIEQLSKFDIYIALAFNGLATGLGSAVGTYLANKHLIEGSKKILNKVKTWKVENPDIKSTTEEAQL